MVHEADLVKSTPRGLYFCEVVEQIGCDAPQPRAKLLLKLCSVACSGAPENVKHILVTPAAGALACCACVARTRMFEASTECKGGSMFGFDTPSYRPEYSSDCMQSKEIARVLHQIVSFGEQVQCVNHDDFDDVCFGQ